MFFPFYHAILKVRWAIIIALFDLFINRSKTVKKNWREGKKWEEREMMSNFKYCLLKRVHVNHVFSRRHLSTLIYHSFKGKNKKKY
jgi:hypothetical protein